MFFGIADAILKGGYSSNSKNHDKTKFYKSYDKNAD